MAATSPPSKPKHSKFLFVHENGNPMVFYLRPCAVRQRLKPDIEHGGGEMTAKVVPNSIKLASDGDYISSDDYISTRFVDDCVKANKLMDLNDYRLKIKRTFREKIQDAEETSVSDISDDEASGTHRVNTAARDYKGRMKFTTAEDIAMLKYIIDNGRNREIQGKSLWRDMETLEITSHSAESMSCRVRKVVLPNIDQYNIENTWKHMLTGDDKYLANSKSKIKDIRISLDPKDLNKEIAQSKSPHIGKSSLRDHFHSNLNNGVMSPKEKTSDQSKISPIKGLKTADQILEDSAREFMTPDSNHSNKQDKRSTMKRELQYLDNGAELTDEDSFDKELLNHVSSVRTRAKSSKSEGGHSSPNSTPSSARKKLRSSKEDNSSSNISSSVMRKRQIDNDSDSDVGNQKKSKQNSNKRKTRQQSEDADTVEMSTSGLFTNNEKGKSDSSKKKKDGKKAVVSPSRLRNKTLSPNKMITLATVHVSSDSPSRRTRNSPKMSPKLAPVDKRVDKIKDCDEDKLSATSPSKKKKHGSGKDSPASSKSKKVHSRVHYVLDTDIESTQTDEDSQLLPEIEDSENGAVGKDKNQDITEINDFVLKISKKFKLTLPEAYHCLWINNGNIDDTLSWIETGYNGKGLAPWDPEDDVALNSTSGTQRLVKKYGEEIVQERQYFLDF